GFIYGKNLFKPSSLSLCRESGRGCVLLILFDPTTDFPHHSGMASSFGQLFRISTWGESHGGGVGVVVDGCPPRLKLSEADIQPDLDRRRPGQSKIVSPRREEDKVQILSGTF